MNGFANATLTLLLGWLKSLTANLWALLNSGRGGSVSHFLANHWAAVALVLCIGGVVVDGIIYLFRWRPYYVWRSKLKRLTRRRERPAPQEEAPPAEPQPAPVESAFAQGAIDWAAANEGQPLDASFGMPQPEPLAYLRDMQAGFARPLPPEQLYPQPVSQPFSESVHPGLNDEALKNSFGLSPQQDDEFWTMDAPPQESQPVEPQEVVMRAPEFRPFTEKPAQEPPRPANPFSRLAKKARGLVGVEDEDSRPTLRDLHSTVDVASAFHEPVYPQPKHQQGGEE